MTLLNVILTDRILIIKIGDITKTLRGKIWFLGLFIALAKKQMGPNKKKTANPKQKKVNKTKQAKKKTPKKKKTKFKRNFLGVIDDKLKLLVNLCFVKTSLS